MILEETLEAHEGQESGAGLEIHEDIEIAVLASIPADGGSEQRDSAHAEVAPECRQIGAKRPDRLFTSHRPEYRGLAYVGPAARDDVPLLSTGDEVCR